MGPESCPGTNHISRNSTEFARQTVLKERPSLQGGGFSTARAPKDTQDVLGVMAGVHLDFGGDGLCRNDFATILCACCSSQLACNGESALLNV